MFLWLYLTALVLVEVRIALSLCDWKDTVTVHSLAVVSLFTAQITMHSGLRQVSPDRVKFLTLIYFCPSLPVQHRPSTTPRHRTLFWAALAIPGQLVPCCFSSASVSRLQLLRGRPLFLFPCWFQVRAWRLVLDAGFLKVCPIQTGWCHNHF